MDDLINKYRTNIGLPPEKQKNDAQDGQEDLEMTLADGPTMGGHPPVFPSDNPTFKISIFDEDNPFNVKMPRHRQEEGDEQSIAPPRKRPRFNGGDGWGGGAPMMEGSSSGSYFTDLLKTSNRTFRQTLQLNKFIGT